MTAPYIDSRLEYLLDLCCGFCGARLQHLSNEAARPCQSCGAMPGETSFTAQPELWAESGDGQPCHRPMPFPAEIA